MLHYFAALAALSLLALFAAAVTGIWFGDVPHHLPAGLFAAILTVGTHTLLILFMIITGRVLREAMRSRPLGPDFLEELNRFFARKQAYPAAVFGALLVVVTAVLGSGQHAFGIPSAVHMLLGLATIGFNLWAMQVEFLALRDNQALLDRAAAELDRIDREEGEWARRARAAEADEHRPGEASRRWLIIAVSAWLPYLYWALVTWRGDFAKVSLHPWVEVSAFGLLAAWLTRPRASVES